MKKFILIHGPTIFIALLIFILSSIPRLIVPDMGFSLMDKFFHFLEFSIFGFFLQRSCGSLNINLNYRLIIVFIIGSLYGVLDEFHQSFIPGRIVSAGDMLADALGILFGQFIYYFKKKLRK